MNQPKRSAFFTGAEGRRRITEETENEKRRREQSGVRKPFRFYVPAGETRTIIICDDQPDFFLYEHALMDSQGRWGREFCGCIKTFDNCPVCKSSGKESYYAMVLTCIDLTEFTTKTGETVDFSRKLLVVKTSQQKKFLRAHQKHGTLRGAVFEMTRDSTQEASIGADIEFLEFLPEDDLLTYTRSWKEKSTGKTVTEKCYEPYDYATIFEEPTEESLRRLVGGEPSPGSRAQQEKEFGREGKPFTRARPQPKPADVDQWEDDDDGAAWEGGEAKDAAQSPAPATKRFTTGKFRRGKAPEQKDTSDEEFGDVDI